MKQFEKAILDAAWKAQKFHIAMTGGLYLGYSHESFLQNFIAREMFNNKKPRYVFVDPSPKKIREWYASASEEDEKDARQRFDLVFWKDEDEVEAIVEIKKAWWKSPVMGEEAWKKNPVMGDVNKLRKYRKESKHGKKIRDYYVLYYTSQSGTDRRKGEGSKSIKNRFCEVDKKIKRGTRRDKQKVGLRHRLAEYICIPKGKDSYPWGFALFRC